MGQCFWYFLAIALILFIISIHSVNNLFRWRTKTSLLGFIASIALLAFVVLDYFNLLNLSFIGGNIEQIIFIVIFFVLVLYFFSYSDIKQFLGRRKMKGKTLNTIERGLLFYCLAKHNPQIIFNSYYQLDSGEVGADTIDEMISIVSTELTNNGIGPDNEPNEHGLQLKSLIDRITELYLSPESKQN